MRERPPGAAVLGFATARRVQRGLKYSWIDDRGRVEAIPGGIRFVGRQHMVVMRDVRSEELIGPVLPWSGVGTLIAGNALFVAMAAGGAFKFFTLDNPWTYAMIGVINLMGLGNWPMRWGAGGAYAGVNPRRAHTSRPPRA